MKNLILLLLLLATTPLFSQTGKISFRLYFKSGTCEISTKEIALYTIESDSMVFHEISDSCSFQINTLIGKRYELRVRSQQTKPYSQQFALTDSLLDLGILALDENLSELDEVTITGIQKKFIQIDAEKTTITVTDNPILEISSVYDAILKIPGVVPYPGGGFALGGQLANVQFDGISSNLGTTDLMNLLKSMPANSISSLELISNPGASYDASLTGAIINIISQGKVTKWFSSTISMNYGLNQNNKLSPSLLMSGKGKKFTWQFQSGLSYNERSNQTKSTSEYTAFSSPVNMYTERKDQATYRYLYVAPSITFRFKKKDNLTLSYRLSRNWGNTFGNSYSGSTGLDTNVNLNADYRTNYSGTSNSVNLQYRHYFDTLDRSLSASIYSSYSGSGNERQTDQNISDSLTFSRTNNTSYNAFVTSRTDLSIPWKKVKFTWNTGLKHSLTLQQNLGKYNLQASSSDIYRQDDYLYAIRFNYMENQLAAYTELKKGFGKKINVTLGARLENYNLQFKDLNDSLIKRNYLNIFPSVHAMYLFTNDIRFYTSYSRKIYMPSAYQFDPNMSGYYDAYSTSSGSSQLKPNFYNQAQAKLTIFDYMELSVNVSHASSEVLNEVSVLPNSLITNSTYRTYSNITSVSYFMSLPVPFGVFTKGMKFFEENVDVDNISFLYLYADCNKTQIPGYNYVNGNKALWSYGVYSQFMLPWKLRLNVDVSYTAKGSYQLYYMAKANSGIEFVLSREFQDRKWKTSLSFQDIFNKTQNTVLIAYNNLNIHSYSKSDTRILWFKLSYTFGRVEQNDGGIDLPSKPTIGPGN